MLRWHGQGHLLPGAAPGSLGSILPQPREGMLQQNPAEAPGGTGGDSAAPGNPWESCEPQVRGEGAREAPALARDSVGAAGAGPSPTAPAVTLSDELHAIRRC